MDLGVLIARAAAAYEAALLGDHGALPSSLAEMSAAPGDAPRAWAGALRALRSLVAPEDERAIDVSSLATLASADDPARRVAARACLIEVWRCVVGLDPRGLAAAHAALRALASGDDAPSASSALALAESARSLFAGDAKAGFEHASRASETAARARLPDTLVGAASLRALALLAQGEIEPAIAVARRGARMARAEGLVVQEYTTGVVLARARRYGGKPHLATRILTSLERVAPSTFAPLLAWERAMVGMPAQAKEPAHAGALRAMTAAARAGDAEALRSAHARCVRELEGVATLADEAHATLAALDPSAPDAALARSFLAGTSTLTPAGVVDPAEEGGVTGYVLVRPGVAPQRVMPAALALVEAELGAHVVREPRSKEARPVTALAALALAGEEGLDLDALFAAIYGFAYASAKHESLLRVVLHRARAELEGAGDVVRRGELVRLVCERPLLVPDPRCGRPLESRVLALLAAAPGTGARDVATQLGLPLRTVQLALRTLVDDGACTVERDGAKVAYLVEDTTFGSPTTARLRAPGRAIETPDG